ncbi:MAG: adenylyltransferase/cytidyltransferase family protein [Caldilinea sp.]|nr:adenylyltransferase/cytidyltransferase family protein [Caldilinea sp.]
MSEAGKKVFVSGCFDMLHSGHVEFLQRAAEYGELTVALGSDRTVFELKGRPPINSEEERRFMLANVACVKQAVISRGSGYLDFEPELRELMPDVFVVNEDGNTPAKRKLCERLGIEYVVLQREPHPGLTPRSTTALRTVQIGRRALSMCWTKRRCALSSNIYFCCLSVRARKISLYWRTLISHRRAPKRWPTPRAPVGTLFWRTI